jgi:hypothetical protein
MKVHITMFVTLIQTCELLQICKIAGKLCSSSTKSPPLPSLTGHVICSVPYLLSTPLGNRCSLKVQLKNNELLSKIYIITRKLPQPCWGQNRFGPTHSSYTVRCCGGDYTTYGGPKSSRPKYLFSRAWALGEDRPPSPAQSSGSLSLSRAGAMVIFVAHVCLI